MHVSSLHIGSTLGAVRSTENPDWPTIEVAIRGLDGHVHTLLGLMADEDDFMQIGGGPGLFVCDINQDNHLSLLFDPTKTPGGSNWIVAGQVRTIQTRNALPLKWPFRRHRSMLSGGSLTPCCHGRGSDRRFRVY
jgi:hypothetical protein